MRQFGRALDGEPRQRLVGPALRDALEIVEKFLRLVDAAHMLDAAGLRHAHIAGVAGIAAAIELWRRLQHDDAAASPGRLIAAQSAALPPPATTTS